MLTSACRTFASTLLGLIMQPQPCPFLLLLLLLLLPFF
jgi:hypothetical protein